MVSQRAKGWKWYDWIVVFLVVIAVLFGIQKAFPASGFAQAIHIGFHWLSVAVLWLSQGLATLANLLEQL